MTTKENRKRWVEALRSGKFKQNIGALREGDKFCCLGVACEIFKDELGLKYDSVLGSYNGECAVLPNVVREHLGLMSTNGLFGVANPPLSALNDRGWSFEKLAQFIESEPEGFLDADIPSV